MVYGITMAKVEPGGERSAYMALQTVRGIKELYCIFGEFSFFLIIEAENRRMLDQILESIQMIEKISGLWPVLVSADSQMPGQVFASCMQAALT